MTVKDLYPADTLTSDDIAFMKRLTAPKNKRNEVIRVNGRNVIVVRRSLE